MLKAFSQKQKIVIAIFATLNIVGLLWIHHDLTATTQATTRVLSAVMLPDTDLPDRFRLTFDRDMVPMSLIGKVEEASLFKVAPDWPGKWVWHAGNKLDYMLDKPIPPGRVVKLTAAEDIQKRTGRSIEGPEEFELATSPLRFKACLIEAYDRSDVTCRLIFNQPVDPGEFLRHVRVTDEETSRLLGEPTCLTKKPESELVVRFRRPESDRFRMQIAPDLTGYEGELALGNAAIIEERIPVGFALLHTYIGSPDLDGDSSITLRFSQRLAREQDIPTIAVTPRVEGLTVHRYDRNLIVNAKFRAREQYTLTVPGTLLADDGRTLKNDLDVVAKIPAYQPKVQFAHSRGILSPAGALTLDAKAVNVETLEVKAWRVHANNLTAHLHGGYVDETSRSVLDTKIEVSVPDDKPAELAVDLAGLLSNPLGLYRIEARATNRYWTRDRVLVAVSDLGITAKRHRDGYMVWVTSLRTAQPIEGVAITGLTYNNQTIAQATTDANGVGHLAFSDRNPDGGIWVITAEKDGDLNYLVPSENQWVLDEVGRGRSYCDHYETMLYTDRGLYRPGEEVHLTGVIRDVAGAIPPAFPLSVRVWRPDGREVANLAIERKDKDQGIFHAAFQSSQDGQTGPYRFAVGLPGDDESFGSTTALVEAFMPVRMEVSAEPTAERFDANTPPTVHVTGRYLWDQPAADLPVKIEGRLWPSRFTSETHKEFTFGTEANSGPTVLPTTQGQLDDRGQGDIAVILPENLSRRLYKITLAATVVEPGGRAVSSNASATLDLLNTHIGLRSRVGQVAGVDEPFSVDWVRLTGTGELAPPGEMTLRLVRVEYDTVLKWVNERRVWQSTERTELVGQEKAIEAHGSEGSIEVTCPDSGSYRLILTDVATGSTTEWSFYASRYGGDSLSVPMDQPERLEIIADKEQYLPDETVKVLVRSPIPGTLLLTTETDRVIEQRITTLAENSLEIQIPLSADLRGSVYLTGSVVRAVDPNEEDWLPHRAMGATQLKLDHSKQAIPVQIAGPVKAQPGDSITVTVQTGTPSDPNDPTFVHLWAVDSGILLAGGYPTPSLEDFFLGPRAAGVWTSDIFSWLLPDYKRPADMTRIGSDAFEPESLRRSPVATRIRKPAVFWQEAVPVDANGGVTTEIPLPDLSGEMRLMAVAVDHDRYGRAEQALTLTAPLLVEASWPRFAAPDDEFAVPVKMFNSTDRDLTVSLETILPAALQLLSIDDPNSIVVRPGKPATTWLKAKAIEAGPVEVEVKATEITMEGTGLTAHSTASFPIRPATAPHSEVELLTFEAGEQLTLETPETFLPGTAYTKVSIGGRPTVQLEPALEQLLGYPYGCVEQTSSRLLSLLYASQIMDPSRAESIDGMVKAGIARLWSMQTPSGGLSYWPGDSTPCLWGTAYAAACLVEAKNAGYKIDPDFTTDLTEFLAARLKQSREDDLDIGTKALIVHVLTNFDEPLHGWMARLAEDKERLDVAARAHLAAAYATIGDKTTALALLPERPPLMGVATSTTGRLTSQTRQEAVWLSALLQIDPNNPMTAPIVIRLNQARAGGQWGSTLNNAAVIAALSQYQTMTDANSPEFAGTIQIDQGESTPFDHNSPVTVQLARGAESAQITSTGRGTIYVTRMTEGLPKPDVVEPYKHQLSVERRWTDAAGNPIDPNGIAVGDLIHVEIALATAAETVHNIAVVDALPGGLEVENPRLATSADTGEPTGDQPDRVEFLDDRVILFCSATARERVFRYALRATTAGTFTLPPIQASCMYDPAYACLGHSGRITISNR